MALPMDPMALPAAADDNGWQFTAHCSGHPCEGEGLSVVCTNEPVLVEISIQTIEQFLTEDKYKVVGFDTEFTTGRAGQDKKVAVIHLCV
ncbi:putative methyltransferase PMT27 [Hordeum vulgare]|nr:putative methyltransferase PMT27 [Hordeum vulgare]